MLLISIANILQSRGSTGRTGSYRNGGNTDQSRGSSGPTDRLRRSGRGHTRQASLQPAPGPAMTDQNQICSLSEETKAKRLAKALMSKAAEYEQEQQAVIKPKMTKEQKKIIA